MVKSRRFEFGECTAELAAACGYFFGPSSHVAEALDRLAGTEVLQLEQLANLDLGVLAFAMGLGKRLAHSIASSFDFT